MRDQKMVVLAAIEDLFVLTCKEQGITPQRRAAFDKYKLTLTRALAPSPDQASQNEADTALRVSIIQLVKEAF